MLIPPTVRAGFQILFDFNLNLDQLGYRDSSRTEQILQKAFIGSATSRYPAQVKLRGYRFPLPLQMQPYKGYLKEYIVIGQYLYVTLISPVNGPPAR